jgi:hypothetical protein
MASTGQVAFFTTPPNIDGDNNLFWNKDATDTNKNFLRFGSTGAKQGFIQTIDKPSPPTENPYNNDFWLVVNAKFDGTNWNRIDTLKPAFALNMRAMIDIPFESGTKGVCLWVAQSGSNPIGAFGASNGWQAAWIATQYRDFVVGGFGIEIDGNQSTGPYSRVVSNVINSTIGLLTNLFLDLTAHNRDAIDKSWFAGFVGDQFRVRREDIPGQIDAPIAWQDLLTILSNGDFQVAISSPSPTLTATTGGILTPGTYYYRITALDASG